MRWEIESAQNIVISDDTTSFRRVRRATLESISRSRVPDEDQGRDLDQEFEDVSRDTEESSIEDFDEDQDDDFVIIDHREDRGRSREEPRRRSTLNQPTPPQQTPSSRARNHAEAIRTRRTERRATVHNPRMQRDPGVPQMPAGAERVDDSRRAARRPSRRSGAVAGTSTGRRQTYTQLPQPQPQQQQQQLQEPAKKTKKNQPHHHKRQQPSEKWCTIM